MDVEFCQKFFCVYWDDHNVFIPQFVYGMYHIDWFANSEPSLGPWDESYLVMVYDPFIVLLNLTSLIFFEDFASILISDIGL